MTNCIANISQRKAARVAGFGILIMSIVAPFSVLVLESMLIVQGDAVTTANNINANEWLFRFLIASSLIVLTCDVVVTLALYVLLKPINKDLALLATFFYLMQDIILVISLVFYFIEPIRHRYISLIGQVFFALHLIVLGYLGFKSGYIPRILSVLLIIGGSLGVLLYSLIYFLFPNYIAIAYPGLAVGSIAELYLGIWLLLKGTKISEMNPEIDSLQKTREEKMNATKE